MKTLLLSIISVSIFILYSCGSGDAIQSGAGGKDSTIISMYPTKLPVNRSVVTAQIDGIYLRGKDDFLIKCKIVKAAADSTYASFAMPGASYILNPDYAESGNGPSSEEGITKLAEMKSGDTFKAVITYVQYGGWHIVKLIP